MNRSSYKMPTIATIVNSNNDSDNINYNVFNYILNIIDRLYTIKSFLIPGGTRVIYYFDPRCESFEERYLIERERKREREHNLAVLWL